MPLWQGGFQKLLRWSTGSMLSWVLAKVNKVQVYALRHLSRTCRPLIEGKRALRDPTP